MIVKKECFSEYKYRAQFEIITKNDDLFLIDIYTDEANKSKVFEFVSSKKSDDVKELNIVNWSTKKQDDSISEMINETLKII
jgi:hypothetical protein